VSAQAISATLDQVRRTLAAMLREAGIESPELDSRILVGEALGLDMNQQIASARRTLTPDELQRIDALAQRRLTGEPIARILGFREFWKLRFELAPATLVPRPETECVVEDALKFLDEMQIDAARIADLGTGTGAILLSLLHERPDATGVATDIDADALRAAQVNAMAHGLERRVSFVECDYAAGLSGEFDVIVSNPPYIERADLATLPVEVRDHDPPRALDGGPDGLAAYRALIPQAALRLVRGGALIVEIGQGQAEDVSRLMTESGLTVTEPHRRDLAGIERVIRARRKR
jgi:release factor glutamine methyltransferase